MDIAIRLKSKFVNYEKKCKAIFHNIAVFDLCIITTSNFYWSLASKRNLLAALKAKEVCDFRLVRTT